MNNKQLTQIYFYTLLSTLLVILGGCSMNTLLPEENKPSDIKHVYEKNYSVGSRMTVNVGEPMIRLKDYWVTTKELPIAMPTGTVSISALGFKDTLTEGMKYPVTGRINIKGIEYTVISQRYLIKPDGTLHNKIVNPFGGGYVEPFDTFSISNPAVTFKRDLDQKIDAIKGYNNYEVLYTGKNSAGLNLTYREYSPEGLARVAFYQNLTYENFARNIAFKGYRIDIHESSSNSITFTIISDGLGDR